MKKNAYAIQSRREQIRARLKDAGTVSVYEMSRLFAVSESTIRRDLETLNDNGLVRFHGGMKMAGPPPGASPETVFEEKRDRSAGPKAAIALAAAAAIQDGQTVFLNAGTTTLALFRQIKDRNICIVTNNMAIIMEESPMRAELLLVGGEYRSRSRSLVGGMAAFSLSQAYADVCFLGTNGVSLERGLTTILTQEAEVNRAMAARARRIVCLADASKLGVDAGFVSLPLESVASLITDAGSDPEFVDRLRTRGTEVEIAAIGKTL